MVGRRAAACSDAQRPAVVPPAPARQLRARWSGQGRFQTGGGQDCARRAIADQAGANRAGADSAGADLESGGQTGIGQVGVDPAGAGQASAGQAGTHQAGTTQAGLHQAGAGQAALDPANQAARDLADCGALMRGGSRTFFAASLLLPRRVCAPATALYAFCRLADDAIDDGAIGDGGFGDEAIGDGTVGHGLMNHQATDDAVVAGRAVNDGARKQAALRTLRRRLGLAYAGAPADLAADRAFAAAIARHDVPRALPEALLEGFEWDAEGRRYEDLAALHAYAARVAGTVGAMMAVLMGVRDRDALARACELGIAMQLTNIARDVGCDARAGRVYLPLSWLRREGIDPDAWLADPVFTPALGRVVQRLLVEATALYESAASGLACLPADCRPAIRAAGLIYAEIGQEIAAAGYDSVSRRARVTGSRKAALILRSLAAVRPRVLHARAPGLPEAQFLVDAAFAEKAATRRFAPARAVETRVLWLLDLFEQLDQRRLEAP